MKKLFIGFALALAIGLQFQPAEAAHVSFSIGGFMPPVMVMDTYYPGYYPYYSTPYYRNSFYFSNCHHRRIMPPPHHGHRHHGGGHRGAPPGGHGGHGKPGPKH